MGDCIDMKEQKAICDRSHMVCACMVTPKLNSSTVHFSAVASHYKIDQSINLLINHIISEKLVGSGVDLI